MFERILRIVGLVVAATSLWFAFSQVDVDEVAAALWRVGPWALAIPLPVLIGLSCEAFGWRMVFARLGHPRLPYVTLWRIRLGTEALLLTLPGGAVWCETLKPYLLKRWLKIPITTSLASIAGRKLLLLGTQSLYLGGTVLWGFGSATAISLAVLGFSGLPWIGLAVAFGLAAATVTGGLLAGHGQIAERFRSLLARMRLRTLASNGEGFSKTDEALQTLFANGFTWWARPGGWFLAPWLLEAVETVLIMKLLGVEVSIEALVVTEACLSLVRHAFFVLPSGIGVQDLGYVAFLGALGVPNPVEVGAAFSILKRGKELAQATLGYGILAAAGVGRADAQHLPAEETNP